ncbi:MAG: cellulase family glycosylhydrolase [Clostridia bacterium]|nr:cellulase family glycosylhydrolase [Clostridia bacterium]
MKFMLGANYWGADYGTEMWLHYNGERIREEMMQLSEYGIKYLRVFPNWRDFQPLEKAMGHMGRSMQYIHSVTKKPLPPTSDGVDMDRIADFRDFCHAAEENGIKLVVSIMTGWMSGRLFVPPALVNKNVITDCEALTLTKKYVHRFVRELKDENAIVMWDLGNESNDMSPVDDIFEAYNWTSTVVDAIRSEDKSRPVSSGMHCLSSNNNRYENGWLLEHQGEICDVLCTHPYPSPTIYSDKEPYNRLRTTLTPTAQTLYYSGVGRRPAYIQENGTFAQAVGSPKMSAQFMNIQILSSLVNGFEGYHWWCAWDQMHLDFAPYTWSLMERQLGLFDKDRKPKPVALTMKKLSEAIEKMPDRFPKRKSDGVCVLSLEQEREKIAMASVLLGKQAGIDLDIAYDLDGNIPDSDFYILPSVMGWAVMYKPTWDKLVDSVKNGRTLCVTYNGGHLVDMTTFFGVESRGLMTNVSHTVEINGETVHYSGKELLIDTVTAEVILRNEEGNPVLFRNKFGKGYVYFINFDVEGMAFGQTDGFNKDPYYLFYREVAKDIINAKPIIAEDRNLGITINPEDDDTLLASVLNYSDKDIVPDIKINEDFEISDVLYGSINNIPACDGIIMRLKKIK